MKMQTLVRMHMLVGLGAALLLASSVRAQQTMDPSAYSAAPIGPQVTASVPVIENDGSENLVAMPVASRQATQQENEMARVLTVDVILLAILMAGIGSITWYAMAAGRRSRTFGSALRDRLSQVSYGPASGATTH